MTIYKPLSPPDRVVYHSVFRHPKEHLGREIHLLCQAVSRLCAQIIITQKCKRHELNFRLE